MMRAMSSNIECEVIAQSIYTRERIAGSYFFSFEPEQTVMRKEIQTFENVFRKRGGNQPDNEPEPSADEANQCDDHSAA